MKVSPIDNWSTLQRAYYLVQVEKLIGHLGYGKTRNTAFRQLKHDLGISSDTIDTIILSDPTPNKTTRDFFEDSDGIDRAFILSSFIIILISEDHFSSDQYITTVSLFTNIFGSTVPDTINMADAIFESNPDIALEFCKRKISDKKPEQIITRDTVVYLVIMVLAIIGLISIFT